MAEPFTTTHFTAPAPRNIADTLADVLPKVEILHVTGKEELTTLLQVAVPKGHELKEIDLERLLPAPRRAKALATLREPDSFIAYVQRHATSASAVWCLFDPRTYALKFCAVFDEIGPQSAPGWRGHQAHYEPAASAEWATWTSHDGANRAMAQMQFAEFLERHESDIAAVDGMPSSLQMMQMATEFEANSDKRIKSVVRLQGGGVRMDYVDDDNADTLAQMKVFERFAIGLPVFWSGPAYRIDARLKYRHASGKVSFWYELIRPDRVHEAAAKELIQKVRDGIGAVPMLMGACS